MLKCVNRKGVVCCKQHMQFGISIVTVQSGSHAGKRHWWLCLTRIVSLEECLAASLTQLSDVGTGA